MNSDMKKIVFSLLFGCSLGFTLMAIWIKIGFPYNDVIKTLIGAMPAIWTVNYRNKIFK